VTFFFITSGVKREDAICRRLQRYFYDTTSEPIPNDV